MINKKFIKKFIKTTLDYEKIIFRVIIRPFSSPDFVIDFLFINVYIKAIDLYTTIS